MELPRDRIAAACLHSQFKDDRHSWKIVMHEEVPYLTCVPRPRVIYVMRRCAACGLTVLLRENERTSGCANSAPRKDDEVIFSFFETGHDIKYGND